jgi:hypothetical protein
MWRLGSLRSSYLQFRFGLRKPLINAEIGKVSPGAKMSGYPTNQELARRSRRLLAGLCCNAPR